MPFPSSPLLLFQPAHSRPVPSLSCRLLSEAAASWSGLLLSLGAPPVASGPADDLILSYLGGFLLHTHTLTRSHTYTHTRSHTHTHTQHRAHLQPADTTRTRGLRKSTSTSTSTNTTPRAPETRTRTRCKTPPSSHPPTPLSIQGQVPSSGLSPSLLLTPTTHTHHTHQTTPETFIQSAVCLSPSIPCRRLNSKQASSRCQPLSRPFDTTALPSHI